jgi:small subunit ribosomal protein S6
MMQKRDRDDRDGDRRDGRGDRGDRFGGDRRPRRF